MKLTTDPTADVIISSLVQKPGLSAKELLTVCRRQRSVISQSGVYKTLDKLISEGIVFKVGTTYRLHLNWVIELLNFSQAAKKQYLESDSFLPELPSPGEKVRWKMTNLYRLNDLFTNVVLTLVRKSTSKLHLSWNPHPWFHLLQAHQEVAFFKALRAYSVRMYKIVGSATPLDRWSEQFWDPSMVVWSYAPSPFHSQPNLYFSVIDDYIVSVELHIRTTRRLDTLYSDALSEGLKGIDPRLLTLVFDERSPSTLTVARDERRAKRIREQYQDYFGLLVPGDRVS